MTSVVGATSVVLAGLAASFVIWGGLHDVVARRRRRRRRAIVRLLTTVLFGDDRAADRATRQLMRERRASVLRALQELAVDLDGQALGRTRHLVDVLGIRTHIAAMARSRRRSPRIRAAELVSLVPEETTSAELLLDEDPLVRALTVEALGAPRLARRRGVIHELLCDPAQVVRATMQDTLIRSGAGIDEIGSALADERTCLAALTVVSHSPDPTVIDLALAHLDSPRPERRALVARALGNNVSPTVSEHLAQLIADEDAEVRSAAVRAAGVAGRGELAAVLGHALSDRAWSVRHAAGEALSRFGPLGAMVLYGHLDDADPYARDMALRFVDLVEEGGRRVGSHGSRRVCPLAGPMSAFASWFFNAAAIALAVTVVITALSQLTLVLSAVIELTHMRSRDRHRLWRRILGSQIAPQVSVLMPAHNEAVTISDSVAGVLALAYPNLEVVVVDDGSTDGTLDQLIATFDLVAVHPIYRRRLRTAEVESIYRSSSEPDLVVVRKRNGGKADALNCALDVASGELVCAIDADTLVTHDCLQQMVTPFLADEGNVAVGGTVRLVNDVLVTSGVVEQVSAPRRLLAGVQAVEYTRAFLVGRLGWNRLGGNLLISGAFGLFRRDRLLDIGGYEANTVGEDMELIVRLRRHAVEHDLPAGVHFVPDPIAWTEAPESLRVLARQRNRWHRGLCDVLVRHRRMIFNRRYGMAGTIGMPYYLVVEALAPMIELAGLILLAIGLFSGQLASSVLAVVVMAQLLAMAVTLAVLWVDDVGFRSYPGVVSRLRLVGYVVVDQLIYRPLTLVWRVWGLKMFLEGRGEWGDMTRTGLGAKDPQPASSATTGP